MIKSIQSSLIGIILITSSFLLGSVSYEIPKSLNHFKTNLKRVLILSFPSFSSSPIGLVSILSSFVK